MFLSDHSVRISKNSSSSPRWLMMSLRIPLTQQSRTNMLTRDVPSNTADAIPPFRRLSPACRGCCRRGLWWRWPAPKPKRCAAGGKDNLGKFSVCPLRASDSCSRERERERSGSRRSRKRRVCSTRQYCQTWHDLGENTQLTSETNLAPLRSWFK